VFYLPLYTNVEWPRHLSSGQIAGPSSKGDAHEPLEEVPLSELFDRMVPEFHALIGPTRKTPEVSDGFRRFHELYQFLNYRFLSYVKFFDDSLPDDHLDNFYMEREWRVVGNVHFGLDDVKQIFIPKDFSKRFHTDVPDFPGEIEFLE